MVKAENQELQENSAANKSPVNKRKRNLKLGIAFFLAIFFLGIVSQTIAYQNSFEVPYTKQQLLTRIHKGSTHISHGPWEYDVYDTGEIVRKRTQYIEYEKTEAELLAQCRDVTSIPYSADIWDREKLNRGTLAPSAYNFDYLHYVPYNFIHPYITVTIKAPPKSYLDNEPLSTTKGFIELQEADFAIPIELAVAQITGAKINHMLPGTRPPQKPITRSRSDKSTIEASVLN